MNLKYITASDPREHVSVSDIMDLLRTDPRCEIAVQAHPSKMSAGMLRHDWFDEIVRAARHCPMPVNLAVHVNLNWANDFCRTGLLAPELLDWFFARRYDGGRVVRRWQINIHGSQPTRFDTFYVGQLMRDYPDHEFVFQYGDKKYLPKLQQLHDDGIKFSVLYDASGGNGKPMQNVSAPLFADRPQGYSGGISPDNVGKVLKKIEHVAPSRDDLWIDAEGKLKNPETNKFDLQLARTYFSNSIKSVQK